MSRTRMYRARAFTLTAVAVLLMACGGGEEPAATSGDADVSGDAETSDDASDGADDDTDEGDEGDEGDEDAGPSEDEDDDSDTGDSNDTASADADDDADDDADTATADQGPDEYRPAEAPSDGSCDDAGDDAPGAEIRFPGDGDEAGSRPVTVEVTGCSNTFEANLEYEAFHGEDSTPTLAGFTTGGTMGDWAAFSFEETYWTPGEWRVVVFEHDAESGERKEYDEVAFTVTPG